MKIILLVTFAAIALWSCANQLGPQGGEVDRIPPEIIYTFPENKTTNYDKNYIELEFSEYVDKRSVQDAVFISPNIDGKIEYDWSGTSLEIIFEDSLRKNKTYTVTVGTEVIDINNRNKMASAFSFTFATGPEIDYCSISGKIYDKDPSGTFVFAYQLSDTIPNPITQKPDYVSQAGAKGDYRILGMAPSKYRVFAVNDFFSDLLYDPGDDKYGCPFKDILLTKTDSLFTGLDYQMTIEDTLAANINELTMTDQNHILVEFTEPVDSSRLSADNFSIIDSTTLSIHDVKMLYKGKKSTEYFISFSDSLIEQNSNYLVVNNIIDKFGNILKEEIVSFVVSTKPDTVAPKVSNINTEYPQKLLDYLDPWMVIIFDDGIVSDSILNAIQVTDEKEGVLNFKINRIDDASYRILITDEIESKSSYNFLLDYSLLPDAAGNVLDTTYSMKVSTVNELDFSGLSGTVIANNTDVVVEISNLSLSGVKYSQRVDSTFKFDFKRVRPGDYLLNCFMDPDSNSIFGYGSIIPFEYSEKFSYYPDTIKLAARWPVGDVEVEIKN